jgi:DNA polymerase-3 subunit beta
MKLTATKERILNAVLLAERITGKKESLPILSCVVLDAKGNEVVVKATNLEAGVEIIFPAEVQEKGVVAVSAAVLSQTLRSISSEKIECKVEDGNLVVTSRGTRTLIKAVPHDEFPTLAGAADKKGVAVSRGELLQGLQAVSYAASPSMIRPELGSIFVSIQQGKILCVATDSFRLAEKSVVAGGKSEADLLIPLKHAQELAYILEHIDTDAIELRADESQMSVVGGDVRYLSRIVDGTFPNYKEILPKKFTTEATVLKNDFAEMLRKARVFSGNDQHVGLHVYPKRKIFSATARSAEVGEMSDSIDAALVGEDLDINFHIGYLGDCLTSIEADSITLGFSGPGKPLVIRGMSDASFTYLVMPLNR